MSVQIKMPALSSTSDEGKICKWLVREGQKVRSGDIIAEVETEDSVIEIEAVEEGAIVKIVVPEGGTAKVNSPIAMLDQGVGSGTGPRDIAAAPAARDAAAAPGPRFGTVSPEAYTPPTAMVRTRFKSAREGSAANTDKRIASIAATTIAPPAPEGPARTTFVRSADMQSDPVAGWLVVVKGPGRGSFQPVFPGMNPIGRDPSQRISLNFGDDTISRQEHAFITYDDEQRRFYLQHGGKANLIRVGDQPVLVPTELKANDLIRIGKTTLRFVPLCGSEFSWADTP
jgi:Biotin-requiring enzyme/FHA domain